MAGPTLNSWSLTVRLMVTIFTLILIQELLVLGLFYSREKSDLLAQEQAEITGAAEFLATTITGEAHLDLSGFEPQSTWDETPEAVRGARLSLLHAVRAFDINGTVRTLHVAGEGWQGVLSTGEAEQWGELVRTTPLLEAGRHSTAAMSDARGEVVAVAPIRDRAGTTVGLVEIRSQTPELGARARMALVPEVRNAVLIDVAILIVCMLVARSLARSLGEIEVAVMRFGDGDYTTPIHVPDTAESHRLSRIFERVRLQIARVMGDLESHREHLAERLATLEAGQPEARSRQLRIAGLDLSGSVILSADKNATGRVVDATPSSLSILFGTRVPDVARGMLVPARVGDGPTIECQVRTLVELGAELRCDLDVNWAHARRVWPAALKKALNQRGAYRVHAGEPAVRIRVRIDDQQLSVPVKVVDLSTTGVGVCVIVDKRTLSHWGTTWEMSLFLNEAEPVEVRAVVRNVGGSESRPRIGLEFVQDVDFEKVLPLITDYVNVRQREILRGSLLVEGGPRVDPRSTGR